MTDFNERANEAVGMIGRLIALTGVTLLVVFLSGIALKPVLPGGIPAGLEGRLLIAMIVGFALVVAHVAAVAMFEQARWGVAGLAASAWRPVGLFIGLAAGGASILVAGAGLLLTEQLVVVPAGPGAWLPWAAGSLGVFAILAAREELIFRGYLFGLLLDRWGRTAALVVTSLLFAGFHAMNPGASLQSLVAVAVAGLLLGAVRIATGSVIAAWLAHIAINWVQAAIFRLPVSGIDLVAAPGYRLESPGATWLTGGSWGIEGGVAAAACFLLIIFLLLRVPAPSSSSARRR